MLKRLLRSRMFAALIGATVVAVVGGGIAWAAIPDSTGVIHGCYAKSTGTLRAIDTGNGQTCGKTEVPLNWNQTGPQGPLGPQGKPGQDGAVGAKGVSGREIVSITSRCDAGQYSFSCHGAFAGRKVLCPSGKVPLGGGYYLVSGPNLISGLDEDTDFFRAGGALTGSQPDDDGGAGWMVTLRTPDNVSSPFELTVYAVCAFAN